MSKKIIIAFVIIFLFLLLYFFFANSSILKTIQITSNPNGKFYKYGLNTDTDKSIVDLNQVLSGGPGKDGIPALYDPDFTSLEKTAVDNNTMGIFLDINGERKFYPYSILVWHEIVNDTVGGKQIAVTFCPLCGTGIVFDRQVNVDILEFGVSGLLFESNLLMYDQKTESLWSQARGQAVVGEYVETELNILSSQLITLLEVREKYPDTKILSQNTGYNRDYNKNPYSNYNTIDDLYFPVSDYESRFHPKELMYVIPLEDVVFALPRKNIIDGTNFQKKVRGYEISIKRDGDIIETKIDNKITHNYHEMWFSWIIHNQEKGVILEIN